MNEPINVERLARAWISVLTSPGDDEDHHHPGCLPPDGDCPVGQEIADFAPIVAAEYARLSVNEGGAGVTASEAAYRKGYKHGYEAAKKEDPRSMLRAVNEGGVAPVEPQEPRP